MHSLTEASVDGKSAASCTAKAEAKSYAEFCSPPFRYSLAAGLLLLISFAVGTVLFSNDQDAATAFTDIGSVIIDGLVTLALFYAAKCSYIEGRTVYLAWTMMAISRLSFTIGDGIWAYTELVLHESPFPSLADYFYILSYPLFLFGILILPSIKFTSSERLKMMLDTGIVMISAVLVFWSLIIAPTIQESVDVDALTLMLSVAYPVMDLILLFAVLELIFKRIYRRDQNSLLFLASGITSLIVTDALFFQQTLEGTYISGGVLDFGWPVGYVLIGLAGMSQADAIHKGFFASCQAEKPHYGQLAWPLYLPYLCAAGAFALLVWSHEHAIGLSFGTLSWAVGGIIGLVIVRQVLALNENARLYHSAQQDLFERKLAEQEIIRLNEELEERVASRTAQLEAANRELQSEIQERTLAEAAMVDSERRLADIINFLPDATFVINKDGVVIAWNRAIEKLTGINAKDMLGRDNYEYALPFYKRRRPLLIDLVLKPDSQFEETYATIKRGEDGTLVGDSFIPDINGRAIHLMASATVLYDSRGQVYGAIESMRDITDRKLAEEDLKSAKNRAEQAMRAKSEFMANMSHEIRTPLNAVIGMAGLLMETDLKPEQRDYLETIHNSGNALLSIINDILDFSKIDGGKMVLDRRRFDLQNCIEISIDLVAAKAAEKGLELAYFLESGVPHEIIGDETRLRQILINLLGNAVKFTEKGEVVLSVSSYPAENGKIELHFSIKDSGIGISQENIGKLFQSFSQVDSSTTRYYGGTGLGLAISRRLAEMMGGRIWVESELGRGSTFHFTIISEAVQNEEPSHPPDLILCGKRAIIVEGSDSVRNMLVKVLSSWGMVVVASSSGKEAMDMLAGKVYDFVIIDAKLPDMSGPDLAREIKFVKGCDAPIVIMVPIGCKILREAFVSDWLSKPIKPLQLRDHLIKLLTPQSTVVSEFRPKPVQPVDEQGLTLLLAEDNPVNQKVAIGMLRRLGYTADVAVNGFEVLQALEKKTYDVILMDIQMPEMDGLDATRQIREHKNLANQPCIVAMTAYALEGDREEFLNAGMNYYISKPIRIEELKTALERCSMARNAKGKSR